MSALDLSWGAEYVWYTEGIFDLIAEEELEGFVWPTTSTEADLSQISESFSVLSCLFNGFIIAFDVWGREGCDFEVCLIGILVLFWTDFPEETLDCTLTDLVDKVCLFTLLIFSGWEMLFLEFTSSRSTDVDITRALFTSVILLDCPGWAIRDFGRALTEWVLPGFTGTCRDDTEALLLDWARSATLTCLTLGLEGVAGNSVSILVWVPASASWVDGMQHEVDTDLGRCSSVGCKYLT